MRSSDRRHASRRGPKEVLWADREGGPLLHTPTVAPAFLLEDVGDGWWDCPSPLRCEILDGPAFHPTFMPPTKFWLVRTEPPIEWHGDESCIKRWGPDTPLARPMEPTTPYALVRATDLQRRPFADPAIIDNGVPAGPASPSPPPRSVAEATTVGDFWGKVGLRRPMPEERTNA
jgi:hypothetical protein